MLFFTNVTILYTAFWTILVTLAVASLRKTTRMSLRDLIDALEEERARRSGWPWPVPWWASSSASPP